MAWIRRGHGTCADAILTSASYRSRPHLSGGPRQTTAAAFADIAVERERDTTSTPPPTSTTDRSPGLPRRLRTRAVSDFTGDVRAWASVSPRPREQHEPAAPISPSHVRPRVRAQTSHTLTVSPALRYLRWIESADQPTLFDRSAALSRSSPPGLRRVSSRCRGMTFPSALSIDCLRPMPTSRS